MATAEKTVTIPSGLGRVPDVAGYLKLSRRTIYRLMDDGTIPFVKINKARRIPWSAVDSMVRTHTVEK